MTYHHCWNCNGPGRRFTDGGWWCSWRCWRKLRREEPHWWEHVSMGGTKP